MDLFIRSCDDFMHYPKNILDDAVHNPNAYYTRLNNEKSRMFVGEDESALDFLDLNDDPQNSTFQSKRVQNLGDLREHLREALNDGNAEPLTRFIFIHARHSRASLRVSYPMICFLFSYLQVMPSYLDFVFPFGDQEYAQDFYFTGFKEECYLGAKHRRLQLPQLGRSGSEMRLCFNLRSVEESSRERSLPWSIRQVAIYHTFDFETGNAVWITVKGNTQIKKRITELLKPSKSRTNSSVGDAFSETLRIHLLLCNWALENWRWYINDLERSVQPSTQTALSAIIERPPSPPRPSASSPVLMSPLTSPRSIGGSFSGFSRAGTFTSMTSPLVKSSRKFSNISQAQTITEEESHEASPGLQKGPQATIRKVFASLMNNLRQSRPSQEIDIELDSSNEKLDYPAVQNLRQEPPVLPPGMGDEEETQASGTFAFADLQHILYTEQKAQEASEMLQLNMDVLEELRQQYSYVVDHRECPEDIRAKCDISRFEKTIRGMEKELRLQHSRFETFHRLLSEHKSLLNSILQYRGMEASIVFAKRAHESAVKMEAMTSNMNDIAHKTRQETVSMRIITLVTLFFLPGTFIGTFFSTGIVNFDAGSSLQTFYPQGLKLFLAICIPMMFLTFVAWYFVYRSVDRRQKKLDIAAAESAHASSV